jgi:prolyl oligopeptidase
VTESLHGEEIVDPYRCLEDDGEAVTDWERRENEYIDSIVDTEGRESLVERLSAVAEHTTYYVPTVAGGRYFQRIEPPEADQPRLTVREQRDDEPEALVGPAELDETTALQWSVPGPDGKRVLYGLTDAGTEQYDLRVLDVDDGEVIDRVDDVGRCGDLMVGWLDDGFYYTRSGTAGDGSQLEKAIRCREVGGARLGVSNIEIES